MIFVRPAKAPYVLCARTKAWDNYIPSSLVPVPRPNCLLPPRELKNCGGVVLGGVAPAARGDMLACLTRLTLAQRTSIVF